MFDKGASTMDLTTTAANNSKPASLNVPVTKGRAVSQTNLLAVVPNSSTGDQAKSETDLVNTRFHLVMHRIFA